MAKKKRITRKQLLREPDEFLTFSGKAVQFVSSHRRSVIGVLSGVVVVVLASAGFGYISKLSERRAYAVFEEGRSHYWTEISGGKPSVSVEETNAPFEKLLKQYPSTGAARLGILLYADLSYHRQDYQKAIQLYQKALDLFAGDETYQKIIWDGVAHAYESEKSYQSAAEFYKKITDSQGKFMKGDAYYNLARMMEASHEREKALEAYNKVIEAHTDTVGFQIARDKVLRLKGGALGAAE